MSLKPVLLLAGLLENYSTSVWNVVLAVSFLALGYLIMKRSACG